MDYDPNALEHLTADERLEFDRLLKPRPWEPHPDNKPQCHAYDVADHVDVLGFGGAAGGGKTELGLGLSLTKHKVCQVFRREGTELRSLIDRVAEIRTGDRDGLGGKPPVWRWPSTTCEVMEFGSVPNLGDEAKFQGRAKDFLWCDEASNFLEAQVRFLMGWVRTVDPKQHTLTLLTFNPPTSAEGRWVIKFFGPWLDKKHKDYPAPPGQIRWFATVNGKDFEVPDASPFVINEETKQHDFDFDPADYAPEDIVQPQSRTFIPSRVSDNPFLMGTNYLRQLMALPEPLRSQMLKGDFAAGLEDDPWQCIPTSWVEAAMARWEKPKKRPVMDVLGADIAMRGRDNTVLIPRHGWWFGEAIIYEGRLCIDGPTVAGYIASAVRDEAVIHIDLFGVGAEPYGHLMKLGLQVIGFNVGDPARGVAADGHMRLFDLRTELIWRMREALEPSAAELTGIALPPSQELLADLCAFKWELRGGVIKAVDRKTLVKELGRSPDYGSAVVLALARTPKRRSAYKLGARGRRNDSPEYDPYRDV